MFKKHYKFYNRTGGMPAMTLEWILNQNGIKTDEVNFDTSVAFAAMSGSFIGGNGDYVSLFDDKVTIRIHLNKKS